MADWTHDVVNNSEEHRQFAHTLGYAVLNASQIEQFTYSYAAALGGTHVFDSGLAKKSFSQRKGRILELLATKDIDDQLRSRAASLWEDAAAVMGWRNIIAHNPITIMSIRREDGTTRKQVAIINMQKTTRFRTEQIEVGELVKIVNMAESVVRGLSECLDEVKTALGS